MTPVRSRSGSQGGLDLADTIRSADEFGRAVRERRRALGLTQEQLAARCGVGKRFVVELEAGKPTSQLGKAIIAANEVGIVLASPAEKSPAFARRPLPSGVENDPLTDLLRF